MTLIVETGLGLANADALITVGFADNYHHARGNAAWAGTDQLKEEAIRRATAYLCVSYSWAGYRTKNRAQSLAWPRSGVIDREGYSIAIDEIPIEIKNAVAEIALRELVSPGSMSPDFTASATIKREKIGQMEVEYLNSQNGPDAGRPILLAVRDMIGQFLSVGAESVIVGSSYRI